MHGGLFNSNHRRLKPCTQDVSIWVIKGPYVASSAVLKGYSSVVWSVIIGTLAVFPVRTADRVDNLKMV
jgi:hypothetical protein